MGCSIGASIKPSYSKHISSTMITNCMFQNTAILINNNDFLQFPFSADFNIWTQNNQNSLKAIVFPLTQDNQNKM